MKIYHYDGTTKEYTGSSEARLDPLELEINKTERWLLPANATFDAPPTNEPGTMVVMTEDGWRVVPIPEPVIEPTPAPIELTTEQKQEALIQAKMQEITRQQAIDALRAEGLI